MAAWSIVNRSKKFPTRNGVNAVKAVVESTPGSGKNNNLTVKRRKRYSDAEPAGRVTGLIVNA